MQWNGFNIKFHVSEKYTLSAFSRGCTITQEVYGTIEEAACYARFMILSFAHCGVHSVDIKNVATGVLYATVFEEDE